MDTLPEEYVIGLVEGEGCFTFDTRRVKTVTGLVKISKIPTFVIAMHERDEELLRKVRNTIGLSKINSHSIYINKPCIKDGYNRGKMAKLIIRDFPSLRDKIVPFFYGRFNGYKGKQFEEWLINIGNDNIPSPYRLINVLYRQGYYDKKKR